MKYKVKILPVEVSYSPTALESWLNDLSSIGYKLVAVDGRNYIFTKT